MAGKGWKPSLPRLARRISQAVFLFAFLFLFVMTENKGSETIGYPVRWFLDLDPLILITTVLSARSVPAALVASLAVIGITLLSGRVFCGWICPLGTLNSAVPSLRKKSINSSGGLYRLKYYILFFMLAAAVFGVQASGVLDPLALLVRSLTISVYPVINTVFMALLGLVESHAPETVISISDRIYSVLRGTVLPFSGFRYRQEVFLGVMLLAIILLNLIERRFWCRYLCPLGALLGLLSRAAPFGIKVSKGCKSCGACANACGSGAIRDNGRSRIKSECLVCFNCSAACPCDASDFGFDGGFIDKTDIGRRGVLLSLAAGVIGVPVMDFKSWRKNTLLIRPPGSRKEREFLNRCVKCGACIKVCPTGGLQPLLLEAGVKGIWTPRLVPVIGSCEYCTLCGQVCPTGAITEMKKEALMKIRIGRAVIDRTRCLPWAEGTPCVVCEEMCIVPEKAIMLEEVRGGKEAGPGERLLRPHVAVERCIGCGKCEKNCPLDEKPAIYVTNSGETRGTDM